MFFTFWSVAALRAPEKEDAAGKSFVQSMLGMMLPSGPHQAPLSKMNFMGLGKSMLKGLMDKKGVPDIDVLMKDAKELGAHLYLCETSSDLFGLKCEELAGGESLERCGVATFLSKALKSKVALFI
jgi:peroxiredoxin family protein